MAPRQRSTLFSKGQTNPASTTSTRGGLGLSPSLTAVPIPLPARGDVVSPSRPYHPPTPPVPSISDHAVVFEAASEAHQNTINETDIVIAVMGLTGAGKSSFVNTATGKVEAVVGNDLRSQTLTVQPVRCLHPDGLRNVVLVDTPGFDDTNISDAKVLKIIAHWLKDTYRNKIKLSGLLYLHRISDVRMGATPVKNLSVFRDLCGDANMKNVILITTMWDEVQDESVGSEREGELRTLFWKDMIRLGSRTCRFKGTRESAWEIIDNLDLKGSHQTRIPLQIQEEMVDRRLRLHETTVAKTLFRSPVQILRDFRKGWQKLRDRARRMISTRKPSDSLRTHTFPSKSSVRPSASRSGCSLVSSTGSTIPPRDFVSSSNPPEGTHSGCVADSRGEALEATIKALQLAYQSADIANIPILRGVIGTALQIAQLIEEMGGTHHAIYQVVESSGWLLGEITQYVAKFELSRGTKKILSSFHVELNGLQGVVTRISTQSRSAWFLLHDADVQAITACTNSIQTMYNEPEVRLAIDDRQAIALFEAQLEALRSSTASRQCQCGMPTAPQEESE